MLAALITPLMAQAARRVGWGILPETARLSSAAPSDVVASGIVEIPLESAGGTPSLAAPVAIPRGTDPTVEIVEASVIGSPGAAADPIPTADGPRRAVSWRSMALSFWLILAALAALRLMMSLILGLRLVHRGRRLESETMTAAAASAAERLGMGFVPELRASTEMRCPAIWCWGRRPTVLVPAAAGASPIDWIGVLCHELAHWVRRDHLSGLVAEFVTIVLTWHPLAWWARHRLGELSELACDDRVLATGLEATDYAETLLELVPQRRGTLALAAVSSRRGLVGRVRHILEDHRISAVVGTRWAIASALTMVLAASAIALAQTRSLRSQAPTSQPDEQSKIAHNKKSENSTNPVAGHTIRGSVLDSGDKPVAGASVFLVGYTRLGISANVTLMDHGDRRNEPHDVLLASDDTGTDGRFTLAADVKPEELASLLILVFARGFGPHAHYLKKFRQTLDASQLDTTVATLRLAPVVPIRGRLLTPSGMPAAGVRVTLNMVHGNETQDALQFGSDPSDERIRSHWPKPLTTDADGRFVLEVVPRGTYALLSFNHPDYAVDEVIVNASNQSGPPPRLSVSEITPVKPTFTHALEPARPVQGRVTDKATGKPLAGMLVEMTPMRDSGGRSFHARTDADGRYRVSGHAGARWYITTVYPPADSGYLAPNNWQSEWPAGARFLEKNFALEKARIMRGQVIDSDTRRPVASAAVLYQPRPGNPRNVDGYEFRNTVLTDKDGQFAITALPGEGYVLVEATGEYVRTKLLQGKSEGRALFPHGQASVDVPESGGVAPIEIPIRKGVTFTASVVGPERKPVSSFAVYGRELNGTAIERAFTSVNFLGDRFVFPGSDPSRTYKLVFTAAHQRLASVVEIQPDPKATQPVEIRLQPAARIHGKVIKPGGLPMTEGQVYPMIVLDKTPTIKAMDRNQILSQEIYSNLLEGSARGKYQDAPGAHGEFALEALAPGMPFYVVATSGGREAFRYVPPLKPGEDHDLGTITLEERKR